MTDEAVEIAVLKTQVAHLQSHVDEIRTDLKEIKATLAEARGGWKTLMLVAGVSSTLGAFLVKYTPWLMMGPR